MASEVGGEVYLLGERDDDDVSVVAEVIEVIANCVHMACARQSMNVAMKDHHEVTATMVG